VVVGSADSKVSSDAEEVSMEQLPLLIFIVLSLALNLNFL
jgi:hypothetical protein